MIRKSAWLLSAGLFALATPAFAQTATSNTDTDKQTAQPTPGATRRQRRSQTRRDSSSRSTPATSSSPRRAATRRCPTCRWRSARSPRRSLQYTGATDIRQLNQIAPSLLVSSTSSEAGAAVARIRGIGTVGDNPGLESSVGVFIDGVYRSRTGIGLTDLGPLDRIEVLRGPQGTLFGRNTSAGLISIITAKPRFEPEVDGAGRRRQLRSASASQVSVDRTDLPTRSPLRLDARLRQARRLPQRRDFRPPTSTIAIAGCVRGQLLFQPSDNFSFRLIGDYSQQQRGMLRRTLPAGPRHVTSTSSGLVQTPSTIAGDRARSRRLIIDDNTVPPRCIDHAGPQLRQPTSMTGAYPARPSMTWAGPS